MKSRKCLHIIIRETITPFNLLTATGMPPLKAINNLIHVIRRIQMVRQIQMVRFPTRSDRWLWRYLLVCTFVLSASTYRLCDAECCKHATPSSLIPCDSSRPADSNGPLPNSIRPLAIELLFTWYFSSPGRYLQIDRCSVLQACHSFEHYTIESLSSG